MGGNTVRFCPLCASKLVQADVDGRTRLRCPSPTCDYVCWDNPIPIVAAIVEMDGRVVLARGRGWPEDRYRLITGFLEQNETAEEGVLREVHEELGLVGEVVSLVGCYPFFEQNQIILVFHVRAEGKITLGEELEAFRLVPPGELQPWPKGSGPALRDWLARRQ